MGLPSRGFCIYSNRLPENGLGVVLSQLGFGPQFRAGVSSLTGPRASTSHKRSLMVAMVAPHGLLAEAAGGGVDGHGWPLLGVKVLASPSGSLMMQDWPRRWWAARWAATPRPFSGRRQERQRHSRGTEG